MTHKSIKILLVGTGGHGIKISKYLNKLDTKSKNIEIFAINTVNKPDLPYKQFRFVQDAVNFIRPFHFDAAIIASPNNLHEYFLREPLLLPSNLLDHLVQ